MSNPPFSGLESLRPFCGLALLYLVGLVVLRMIIWPFAKYWRRRARLDYYARSSVRLAINLVLALGLLLIGLFGFMAVTGSDISLDLNLNWLRPDEVSPLLALLLLVVLLALALLPIGGGRR
ncbi:MAG TPA: hypothetical protein VER55_07120 [Ardenticatenaceae bacterium]|nr:hypothetical protein [Ardenticatenaceae bacterium]